MVDGVTGFLMAHRSGKAWPLVTRRLKMRLKLGAAMKPGAKMGLGQAGRERRPQG